ncbi:retinoid-inducible serine carboxypeptidase-like [Ischnura elegans]|uniref:retinoid-inducible serine carboxypeptidase-like n=1 Tax=Ischnura elegans TaxID=197161 RepID=UPI001ED89567|nr:retinoid-inducible serine carboxypeptidase-like [Ischnura elegans]XP_046403153.1 retinoid-inducible serine carboxypeptidase-like [Ischnura elegans]
MRLSFAFAVAVTVWNSFALGQNPKSKQSWGYVDVRPGAHIFWWLHYADGDKPLSRPLVLWLQGGPGSSSTGFGNFAEIGPLTVDGQIRNSTWVKQVNVLFVDSPVGAGYSYVDGNKTSLLCKNNSQIATDLTSFMMGFLAKLPDFSTVPFYIFSESYGGKMAAEFARMLYKSMESGKLKIAFAGVALGDPWISPMDSVQSWAPYLLETGVIDSNGFRMVEKWANLTQAAVLSGNWTNATMMWSHTEDAVTEVSHNVDFYNILALTKPSTNISVHTLGYKGALYQRHVADVEDEALSKLMNGPVRENLRVIPDNVTWGSQSKAVFDALTDDFMRPATNIVETLLNSTKLSVTVYSGQLDLVVATPGTLKWVENLRWAGSKGWLEAKRIPMVVNGFTQGYFKKMKNFSFFWINRAGHMVPKDNPSAALALLKAVTMLK